MNCQCRCGCPIWSSKKSNRNICRHCEAGKHTGDQEEVKVRKGRPEGKKIRCSKCRVPVHLTIVNGRRKVVHDTKFYVVDHKIEAVVVA